MHLEALARRVRGEYREMPGMTLTLRQACRFWHLDPLTCERVLTQLVAEKFLYRDTSGRYTAWPRVGALARTISSRVAIMSEPA